MGLFLIIGASVLALIGLSMWSSAIRKPKVRIEQTQAISTTPDGTIVTYTQPDISTLEAFSYVTMKQRFDAIGWLGILLLFGSPSLTVFLVNRQFGYSNGFAAYTPDYTVMYALLSLLSIVGLIFIIIGREFYFLKK